MSRKITVFSKNTCVLLSTAIEEALKGVAAEYGLQIKTGSGQFDRDSYELKLQIGTRNEDGTVNTRESGEFKLFCRRYNLSANDLGRTFTHKGRVYTVIGLKSQNVRYPILVEDKDGHGFKFPQAPIVKALHPDLDPNGSFGRDKDGSGGRDISVSEFEAR